ncbi:MULTISPECIES: Asp-tRNA(Asn)/Glu-tRNA(Gln) amidotransferase subunit GatA [Campylobacter]|uniref:Glutamyl-tRNA(Gln) amidotransferase subunit A n=2 Tax=Campylobacter TaxID=194 RepID=A0ABZ2E5W4_9BACT|nr:MULTISPECIES: Asp-tRNA(Asn)/Glu-tRNA(Gln) amidotransferase subunit GatA [unclassified Campylobacter]ARR04156.1 Glu-tRNA(Gln) amidotransferase, subunit A [Campylobacter sp. RM12175]MCR8690172.1 Asp-tRNA(Asn)/Glu-tRNA(Gln) amidotransferase subunit GatA [Campylobacter sp. RM9264]MCR8700722.1 Asp-tRNA(Asn)/Glu-tRNA(Gln) amidotransferase subunit GatA [Campylobacter sp. RM12176]
MISLKEAMKLSSSDLELLRKELINKIEKTKEIGAYVEQLTNSPIDESFAGVPIAIKDNIQVKNWAITSCSKILQGYKAPYNATVIEKLILAGLAPFGRTNMDEFAMGSTTESSYYGRTLNPLDHSRVPGGSSGGSAAAVAAGIAIAALGSDTGGSIRQPAAFCGCVGFKPTYGRVSRYGLGAYSSSLDQIGPITQNVEDAAILYDIIAGHDKLDSTSANVDFTPVAPNLNPNRKLKIAVIKNYVDEASTPVKDALNLTIEKLKNAGYEICYKELANSKYDIAAYYIIATAEASANLSRYDGVRYGNRASADSLGAMYANTRGEGFGAEVQRRMLLGTFVLSSGYYDAYYIKAQKARAFIKHEYDEILNEVDIILMPVAPSVAYKFGELKDPLSAYLSDIYTIGVNLAGLPAITVPVANDENGLNISAQLIGGSWQEQTVLDAALSLENIIKGK